MSVLPSSLRHSIIARMHRSYLTMRLPRPIEAPLCALEHALYDRGLDDVAIDRPVFIVGCHRSGTTVLYEALAAHPDLAYFTNASNGLPRLPILANKLCQGLGLHEIAQERFLRDDVLFTATTPNEGVQIWELHARNKENHCLDDSYHNPVMDRYLTLTIKKHLKYFSARRFINKDPECSVRLRYLNKLFPDALFIHIVRDARAVCSSLIKARGLALDFFGPEHRYARFGIRVQGWEAISQAWREEPAAGSGLLWREIVESIARDRRHIAPERFLEIRYEDFMAQPQEMLHEIARFCDLPRHEAGDAALARAASGLRLEGRNDAWKQRLNPVQVERLMGIVAPAMRGFGYAV